LVLLLLGGSGCVYYNTFFNARQSFSEAESSRKSSKRRGFKGNQAQYERAIEKSLKIVENYPNSKYYDDALYVLTVSYYWTEKYNSTERRARELLANYADSKYAEEVTVYLAKAKLEQGDIEDAMEVFGQIFETETKREYKAEAAMGLGNFHYENRDYELARSYLRAVRDSLGDGEQKRLAQRYIADSYFDSFHFGDAQGAYLQLLGMDPPSDDYYHALWRAAACSYRLQRLETGRDYLRRLMEDERYFDSLGVLKLKLAEGFEWEDDLVRAEELYFEVAEQEEVKQTRAEAYYNLGIIQQFDYDDLTKAKEYYDSTASMFRSSPIGRDALQRSSDIGKLETFRRPEAVDTSATQDVIDQVAYTQYQLAELYWEKLNKPDTAMMEMRYVVDSFPDSYDAPKAMISLAGMTRSHLGDTAAADSILREVLVRYPGSDFVAEALEELGLRHTAADTGYAARYLEMAEAFFVDEGNIDSARYYYQLIADRFPESEDYLRAQFALIWLTEEYEPPGDSTLFFAYSEFADSFPNNDWSRLAKSKIRGEKARQQAPPEEDREEEEEAPGERDEVGLPEDQVAAGEGVDTTSVGGDYRESYYVGPDDQQLQLLQDVEPIRIEEPFEYPQEAYQSRWQGYLYFQILLDSFGEVADYRLVGKSPVNEINYRAGLTVESMAFDATQIDEELQETWVVYKFEVLLPEQLR